MSDRDETLGGEIHTGNVSDPGAPFPVVSEGISESNGISIERFPEPKLASDAAKAALDRDPDEDLTLILTCGDAGGMFENDDGEMEECDNPSSYGIPYTRAGITPGKCFYHTEQALGKKAKKKAIFLDTYCGAPEHGVSEAAATAGVKPQVVYHWMRSDKEFRQNLEAIKFVHDAMAADDVESTILQRLKDPKAGADTLRQWWLINRRPGRWRNPNKAQPSDSFGGTSAPNISGGQHVWMIGSQKISFD